MTRWMQWAMGHLQCPVCGAWTFQHNGNTGKIGIGRRLHIVMRWRYLPFCSSDCLKWGHRPYSGFRPRPLQFQGVEGDCLEDDRPSLATVRYRMRIGVALLDDDGAPDED